jgi:DNA polymerase I-like protein with 3'-5' exonuclease and polymerase domains
MQIKDCFKSRYGEEGCVVEIDYSQLEVIGTAIVSDDPNMKQDIRDGIDSHSQSASWLNPYTYKEIFEGYKNEIPFFMEMRKKAKRPRFELQYGAGANSIAASNNISKLEAQEFIDKYYERYSVLKAFQDEVARQVELSKFKTGKHTRRGYPIHGGIYRSITGRSYYFEEDDAPSFMEHRGIYTSFNPTKFKNYPMQGFSTGDIVPEMLGRLNENINHHRNRKRPPLLINTIHDSALLDMLKADVCFILPDVIKVMEAVPSMLEEVWGIKTDLPFAVGVEVGDTWATKKNWRVE